MPRKPELLGQWRLNQTHIGAMTIFCGSIFEVETSDAMRMPALYKANSPPQKLNTTKT